MLTAKELMHQATPTLSFDTTVGEAIAYFKKHSVSFAAVCASADRYHGVLTEGALVRIYLRSQSHPEKQALIFYRDSFEPTQLINENEVFPEVVKKLMTAVGHRVFVIDSKSNVIGHITAKDILPQFTTESSASSGTAASPAPELKSQLYMYENFFSKSPFMMHSVNHDGVIQMANEMLHAVLEYEYGELIGKTIFDLYPPHNHKKAEEGIKTIFDTGYHKVIRAQMLSKKKEVIEVELVSRALADQKQQPIGTITVSRPMDMEYLLRKLPSL